ncbi:LamG domain-containing protein [Dysgonomonas sp. 511]|uniref:LamG domain-containing protein n=1 Tax=Dysgonomonas sp. 511 TaxID=2302930 RepID=UPI0013D1AF9E|nr:LamG domain-containing protein [Dysgonomonas sp. 511]NDV77985.1 LamG domain-containing protein [Dysgonomonas sp. 511]
MNKYLKYITTLLLLSVAFSFLSCDDDDDTVVKDVYEIIVNKPVVRLGANEQATVKVVLGNEGYSVKSYDTSIATASISGDVVTVKSLNKQGATTVEITDQEGVIGNFTVAVGTFELQANVSGIEMERLNETSLVVSSGNFSSNDELDIVIADPSVVSIENTDPYRPYYTVKGIGIGTTTITFTDRLGKELVIDVDIVPITIDTDIIEGETKQVGVNNKAVVNILKGNGNYVATPVDDSKVLVKVVDNTINIIGKSAGATTILLEDGEGQTFSFEVNVNKIDKVANIGTSNYFSVPFHLNGAADPAMKGLNAITYESRFMIENLNGDDNGNARINTIMGVEKIFLMRVDVRKGQSGDRYIQLAADNKGGIRYEGSTKIEPGVWYNAAIVVDPAKSGTDKIKLYINGVEETLGYSSGTPADLKDIDLTSNFFIGQSDGKRRLNGAISYARIWTKALDAGEIAAYNSSSVDPSADGLAAYWAFNNGAGDGVDRFISLTDNNYEAKAANKVTSWTTDPILE